MVETLKTGTTTVGLVCKDGIVLAADKRASLGGMIVASKRAEKIHKLTDNMAVTWAGSVADLQLLTKVIKAQLKLNAVRTRREPTVKETANLMAGLIYSNMRNFSFIPSITAFLLGGRDSTGLSLYSLGISGDIMESKDYEADGSGMMFALGVLESMFRKDMQINEGVKLAVKAVNAAMQRDTGSGDGIDVFTITKDGVKKVLEKHVDTVITA